MAGNRLGPRGRFQYTSDNGVVYNVETDADLATAGELDAAVPGAGQAPPRRFKPRGVYCQSTGVGPLARRFVICNDDFAGYATTAASNITIDGEVFITTGRRGESLTF